MTFHEEIESKLFGSRDEKYAVFQRKLMPTVDPDRVIGVRMPALRSLAREYVGVDAVLTDFFRSLPHSSYEEDNLHALWLNGMEDTDVLLAEAERFLPFINNWATCDLLRPKAFVRMAKEDPDRLIGYVRRWLSSGSTYTVRFGIEVLMTCFLGDPFRSEYPEWVSKLRQGTDGYYVRMMAAWYFAEAYLCRREEILPYFRAGLLEKDVWRMAIRKVLESDRATEEDRHFMRSLRSSGGYSLRQAERSDESLVYRLYRSAIGTPFSAWNEEYPGLSEIRRDTETGNLWLMTCGERVVGAFSVMPENEMDGEACWQVRDEAAELTRVVVSPAERGRGLSRVLVGKAIGLLRDHGARAIHLSVAVGNVPAWKNYLSLGFTVRRTCEMYGGTYHLCELIWEETNENG